MISDVIFFLSYCQLYEFSPLTSFVISFSYVVIQRWQIVEALLYSYSLLLPVQRIDTKVSNLSIGGDTAARYPSSRIPSPISSQAQQHIYVVYITPIILFAALIVISVYALHLHLPLLCVL